MLGAASLLENLFHAHLGLNEIGGRMSLVTALCFVVLGIGFVLAQISPLPKGSPILGTAGVLVGALAAACGISIVWGGGDAFGLGNLTRMALSNRSRLRVVGDWRDGGGFGYHSS